MRHNATRRFSNSSSFAKLLTRSVKSDQEKLMYWNDKFLSSSGGSIVESADVQYSNTLSSLAANNIQDAIDELADDNDQQTVGPAGAAVNQVATFADITGKLVQATTAEIDGGDISQVDTLTLINQGATPTVPDVGNLKIYSKTDDLIYVQNDAGVETTIGGGGGSLQSAYDFDNVAPHLETINTGIVFKPAAGIGDGAPVLDITNTADASKFTVKGDGELVRYGVVQAPVKDLGSGVIMIGSSTYDTAPAGCASSIAIGVGSGVGVRDRCVAIGVDTHFISGNFNTAIGHQALFGASPLDTAFNCTAIGYRAMPGGTGIVNNTAVGSSAMASATSGGNNSAVGFNSLWGLTSATNNVGLGMYAGTTLQSGGDNTFIGYNSNTDDTHSYFRTAIGSGAVCDTDNHCVIGNSTLATIKPGDDDVCDLGTFGRGFKNLYLSRGIQRSVTYVTDPTHSIPFDGSEHLIMCNRVGTIDITLPSVDDVRGQKLQMTLIIKDTGGNAGAHPITIHTADAWDKIDGLDSLTISESHNSVTLFCDASQWYII